MQFGGATGTLASFGTQGLELALGLATGLGLSNAGPWQTERSVVRELASGVANVAVAVGKIAHDIVLMAQTEVAELREATSPGRGGSSALPHKQNPVGAIAAGAAARRAPGALATVFAAFDQSHERASGAWHAESCALVDLFVYAGGALAGLRRSLTGIEVDTQAMRRNFDLTLGLLMSEAVSMALTLALGRTGAQARRRWWHKQAPWCVPKAAHWPLSWVNLPVSTSISTRRDWPKHSILTRNLAALTA